MLTNDVKNQVQLVTVVSPGEERPSAQKLSEDTAHSPYINCLEMENNCVTPIIRV